MTRKLVVLLFLNFFTRTTSSFKDLIADGPAEVTKKSFQVVYETQEEGKHKMDFSCCNSTFEFQNVKNIALYG